MSKCRQCGVEILDRTNVCPLCKCVIEQEEGGRDTYPDVRFITKKLNLAARIFLFSAILLEVILVYINHETGKIWWSAITGAGLAYAYFIFRFAVLNNSTGYKAKFLALTVCGVLYVILIDYVIGYRGWSVNFVLPAAIFFIDLGILIFMFINRRNWQSYMMLELFMIGVSIIPLILVKLEIATVPLVSYLAFAASVFLFLGTFIIGDRRARVELKRRFHVR